MNNESILTLEEVCEMLKVDSNTVQTLVEKGSLVAIKTNGDKGDWHFHKDTVDTYLKQNHLMDVNDAVEHMVFMLDDIPPSLLEGEPPHRNASIWKMVNRYYGIRSIFGSLAVHADMSTYHEIIQGKSRIWIGEGAINLGEITNSGANSNTFEARIFASETKYAYGVVKTPSLFDTFSYVAVPLLVVKDSNDKRWVVDGTLQQFFPNLEKGLVIMPYEKASAFYLKFNMFSKEEFPSIYESDVYPDQLVEEAKKVSELQTSK